MNDMINDDLYRVYGAKGWFSLLKEIKNNPGFRFMYLFRKASKYQNTNKILFKLYNRVLLHYRYKYGIELIPGTKVGEGFYIGHVGGIVINSKAIIGKNVNILNGALIGFNPRGKYKGCPTIGDKVWIGANAVIVGSIKVGNNVVVAPNTLVNRDVPDNSVVYGNPMKISENLNATKEYINYTI